MSLISNRRFIFNWKISVFALACLVLFVQLGFWQLSREVEKREFLVQQQTRAAQDATTADQIPLNGELYGLPVMLQGSFDEESTFLLDNRVLDGKVGFEVQQLFRDISGRNFLVNRGFVQMGRTRQDVVSVPPVAGREISIKGYIYQRDTSKTAMQNGDISKMPFPVIVQHTDIVQFGKRLGLELYPHLVRLNEGESGALPRHWPDTTMQPEQHRGYAIQWFTMALAVTLAWMFASFRKEENEVDTE